MMKKFYETPQVEVIEIEVEKGFATSDGYGDDVGIGGEGDAD